MILVPIVARTTEEMVRLVPNSLREAALALGYQRWRATLQVVVRTAASGIVTGCLVAVARVAGETAPLLFTALGKSSSPPGLTGADGRAAPAGLRATPSARTTSGIGRPGRGPSC